MPAAGSDERHKRGHLKSSRGWKHNFLAIAPFFVILILLLYSFGQKAAGLGPEGKRGVCRVEKMIARIMESGTRLAFVLLLLFVVVMATFQPWVALGELLLVAIVYIYYRARAKRRRADIRRTVETLMFQVDDASKNSLELSAAHSHFAHRYRRGRLVQRFLF